MPVPVPVAVAGGVSVTFVAKLFSGRFVTGLICSALTSVSKSKFKNSQLKLTCVAPVGADICCTGIKSVKRTSPVVTFKWYCAFKTLFSAAFLIKSYPFRNFFPLLLLLNQ